MVNSGTYYGLSLSASNLIVVQNTTMSFFMYFSWMVNSGTYYGLSLSASNPWISPKYNYVILYVL